MFNKHHVLPAGWLCRNAQITQSIHSLGSLFGVLTMKHLYIWNILKYIFLPHFKYRSPGLYSPGASPFHPMGLFYPGPFPPTHSYTIVKKKKYNPQSQRGPVLVRRRTNVMSESPSTSPLFRESLLRHPPSTDPRGDLFSSSWLQSSYYPSSDHSDPEICHRHFTRSWSPSPSPRNSGPGPLMAASASRASQLTHRPRVSFAGAARRLFVTLDLAIIYYNRFTQDFDNEIKALRAYAAITSIDQIWKDKIAFADQNPGRHRPSQNGSDYRSNTGYDSGTQEEQHHANQLGDLLTFSDHRVAVIKRSEALSYTRIPSMPASYTSTGRAAPGHDDQGERTNTRTRWQREAAEVLQQKVTRCLEDLIPHLAGILTRHQSMRRALKEMNTLRGLLDNYQEAWTDEIEDQRNGLGEHH